MSIENPVIYVPIRRLATGNWRLSTVLGPLHLSRTLYKSATLYAKQTQFPKSQMNVNPYNTRAYENKSNWTLGENKPNSNPICQRVKLMQSVYLQRIMKKNADRGYEKTKPKQTQFPKSPNECKLTYNKGLQKKRRFRSPKKQTQFKPNFRQEMPKMLIG